MYIARQIVEICVLLDKPCFKSALIEMSAPFILGIIICGIRRIDIMHNFSKGDFRCLNNQVIMIIHKDI